MIKEEKLNILMHKYLQNKIIFILKKFQQNPKMNVLIFQIIFLFVE